MWTTLNFRGRGKTKETALDIYKRTLDIEFERDRSVGLGSTFGDGHKDRQTHTHTDLFLKRIFRLWKWCRIKNHQKIEVEFFDECNTSFTPNVAQKWKWWVNFYHARAQCNENFTCTGIKNDCCNVGMV